MKSREEKESFERDLENDNNIKKVCLFDVKEKEEMLL